MSSQSQSHSAFGAFQQVNEVDASVDEASYSIGVEQIVQQIKETADKLITDRTARGDVKLLSTALKELRYSFKVFGQYERMRKVTVFGSARLKPDHPSYLQAIEFSKRMVQHQFMVITGAASGIMEAGHVGAGRDMSIGINIQLPFEQSANPIIQGDKKLMNLKYFFTRKLMFVKEAEAVVLFPGGFGTLDEGFEVLTLLQTGKSHLFPIVMVDEPGGDFWRRCRDFIQHCLLDRGMISPADMSLFRLTDSVDEAVDEVLGFYRVYHSMRYVNGELVLRLLSPLPAKLLESIRHEFADIVESGTISACDSLPQEANESQLVHLPRLKFWFDRKNLGRLRQMIDRINQEG